MQVPLVDLRASLQPIKEELFREFDATLDGMQLRLGPNVQAFEQEFASYCHTEHGVALSNGTDALYAALHAFGIGAGDEVIAPSHTFFATIEAIIHVGAVPVMVDVEPGTLTIDPDAVQAAVTNATKAIIPVHLYGHPANMDPIMEIARHHGLRVIEDAAQAHGARYKGRYCGSMGDAASFSFYFTKNLGAFGEGGFMTTPDPDIAAKARLLREHGQVSAFEHALIGHNFRMDELQAIVLRLKLPNLDRGNQQRRQVAEYYRQHLANTELEMLEPREDSYCVHHVFPIRSRSRDALRQHLGASNIGTGIHYKIPCHCQPALKKHAHRIDGDLSVTEAACRELLSIPMYPEITEAQLGHVTAQILSFTQNHSTTAEA